MKFHTTCVLLAVVPFLVSCASEHVALSPVGPNPEAKGPPGNTGYLQVFSEREPLVEGSYDGSNGIIYHHTDYNIYDTHGRHLEHVGNAAGHFDSAPRLVPLPAGEYVVRARGKDYLFVQLPVVIKGGRVTRVHLDDRWSPNKSTAKNQLVTAPNGTPVGWRANPATVPASASGKATG